MVQFPKQTHTLKKEKEQKVKRPDWKKIDVRSFWKDRRAHGEDPVIEVKDHGKWIPKGEWRKKNVR